MEARLELCPVVGLNDQDPERQAPHDVVHKLDRRPLVAGREDLQYSNTRAVVHRGELIEPGLGLGNPLEKFHIELQAVSWLRLLVALPAFAMWSVLLVGREPIQTVSRGDAMHGGRGDHQAMEALEVGSNAARSEVIGLPQEQDLPDHIERRRTRRLVGAA